MDRPKVIKQRRKTPKPFGSTLKLREKLLKNDLMQISKRNAIESPLLRLPGEVRNMIWECVLSNHLISIHGQFEGSLREYVYSTGNNKFARISLGRRLLSACRQIYEEASTMVYTLNTISFSCRFGLDLFVSRSKPEKLRLITSIEVPYYYYKSYTLGYCKKFHEMLPNIKHLSIYDYLIEHRHLIKDIYWTLDDMVENGKRKAEDLIRSKEGRDIEMSWYCDLDGLCWLVHLSPHTNNSGFGIYTCISHDLRSLITKEGDGRFPLPATRCLASEWGFFAFIFMTETEFRGFTTKLLRVRTTFSSKYYELNIEITPVLVMYNGGPITLPLPFAV